MEWPPNEAAIRMFFFNQNCSIIMRMFTSFNLSAFKRSYPKQTFEIKQSTALVAERRKKGKWKKKLLLLYYVQQLT